MRIEQMAEACHQADSPIKCVLRNRGVKEEYIDDFVNGTVHKYEQCPSLFDNMQEGLELLERSIEEGKKTYLLVDPDVDGYTSAAIMILYLRERYDFDEVTYLMQEGKQHGIVLDEIPEDCEFLILPDSSSNDYKEHKALKERGVDILILDHHEAPKYSEDAVVINNQLSEKVDNKALSGAAVVYKFCKYIDMHFSEDDHTVVSMADNYMDLVAMSLVGDMMDMREPETFSYISKGMGKAEKNEFFAALIEKQSYSLRGDITPISTAFYIAPLINACIRVGTAEDKQVTFEAFINPNKEFQSTKRGADEGDVELAKDQATRLSSNARNRQAAARDRNVAQIEATMESEGLLDNQILFVKAPEDLDPNITGLIANDLMGNYQRPVLLLRETTQEDENGVEEIVYSGSGRCYDGCDIENFREYLLNTGYFNFCAGHPSAFGASINEDDVEEFLEFSNSDLEELDFDVKYSVDFQHDAVLEHDNLVSDLAEINKFPHFWGKDMDEPFFYVTNVEMNMHNVEIVGQHANTLKVTVGDMTFMKFFLSDEEKEYFGEISQSEQSTFFEIVGKGNENDWMGNKTQQIFLEDYNETERKFVF